jgi:predicted small lipoprotein YifL
MKYLRASLAVLALLSVTVGVTACGGKGKAPISTRG